MWRLTALFVILVPFIAGCSADGLSFRQDHSVEITSPEEEGSVTEPATVTWTVEGFEVTGPSDSVSADAGYFGVYLNRTPQPPGELLDWFVRDDKSCNADPTCPDKGYYRALGIFTRTDTSWTMPPLPPPPDGDQAEFHEVTIALLDGSGRRIGESQWRVRFELERENI